MAYAIEAYEAPGAIALARIYSVAELKMLVEQTCKLRRDPEAVRAEIDKADNEEWIENNLDSVFVFKNPDGEIENFSIGDFFDE